MKYSRYSPPLNSQCLCGSGLKFKRCCGVDNGDDSKTPIRRAQQLIESEDYEAALTLVRLCITNYTILHKTNTEPFISSHNEGLLWLLDTDMKALSELIESLIDCYRGLGDYESLSNDLERLRKNVSHPRWQRKITYFQIIAKLGDHWNESVGKREVKKLQPLDNEEDAEIIQLYFHFLSDHIAFSQRLEILDRLISLVEDPGQKLQYSVAKGIEFLCIGDETEATQLIERALEEYEKGNSKNDTPYGRMQYARALGLLGDLLKSAELKERSVREFHCLLRDHHWKPMGVAEIHCEIGQALYHLGRYEESVESYHESMSIKPREVVKVFLAKSQAELNDCGAITTIKEVQEKIQDLKDSERLDFAFSFSFVAIKFKDKDMIWEALEILDATPSLPSIFERQKSELYSEIYRVMRSGDLNNSKSILKTIRKLLSATSRYLILQPNIAGLGINLNRIADDISSKEDVDRN